MKSLNQIAAELGVTGQALYQLRDRRKDFPAAEWQDDDTGRSLYDEGAVAAWYALLHEGEVAS